MVLKFISKEANMREAEAFIAMSKKLYCFPILLFLVKSTTRLSIRDILHLKESKG